MTPPFSFRMRDRTNADGLSDANNNVAGSFFLFLGLDQLQLIFHQFRPSL